MNVVDAAADFLVHSFRAAVAGWNRFWFTAVDPATLGLTRIFAGAMLLYVHAVWTLDLMAFFGPHSWVSHEVFEQIRRGSATLPNEMYGGQPFTWSVFFIAESPEQVWTVHVAALVSFTLLTVGLCTRFASVLAWVFAVSYVQRTPGALFGLDQITTMLAFYLMIGPSGACYSLDAWLRRRKDAARAAPRTAPNIGANVSIRLIQLHMCVIYMYAGIGKLVGEAWWNGTGLWGGVANLEYQSLDATWLAQWPMLTALLSHVTVFWEIYYVALIWPKATRPWMLLVAIPLHLGIACFMGMITFGLIMLVGNMAFVRPAAIRATLEWLFRRQPVTIRPIARRVAA